MSDPVTNVEIEDVLSSIRRLVSEDSRAPEDTAEREPQHKAEAQPAAPERLVLTPALRVSDPKPKTPPEQAAHPAFSEAPGPDEMRLTSRLLPSEEELSTPAWRRASLEPVRPEVGEEPAARHADSIEVPEPDADAPMIAPASQAVEEAEEAPFIEVTEEDAQEDQGASIADFFAAKLRDTPRGPAPEPIAEIAPKEGSLARKIAELEEMIARSTSEFEPETGEEAPEAIFRHQPMAAPQDSTDEPQIAPQAEPDEDDAELASRPMPEPELVDRPFETDATGEPDEDDQEDAPFAFRRSSFDREPIAGRDDSDEAERAAELDQPEALDVPEVPKPSARRPVKILRNPVWQRSQSNLRREAEELGATPRVEQPVEQPAAPVAAQSDAGSESQSADTATLSESGSTDEATDLLAALDQETLRKLVADVVREELQGAVGERVTRNLRKLVRQEIQRIAMSADLD